MDKPPTYSIKTGCPSMFGLQEEMAKEKVNQTLE
jgi:hypothetical protein